jgi:hypothetical protein
MMNNLLYDQLLCFGKLTAPGTFPDELNLGRTAGSTDSFPGAESTDANRKTVDVLFDSPSGGSATVTVEGSADGSTGWTAVGINTFSLDQMKRGPCMTAVSPNEFQYLRVTVSGGGFLSASAYLNTYAGK